MVGVVYTAEMVFEWKNKSGEIASLLSDLIMRPSGGQSLKYSVLHK